MVMSTAVVASGSGGAAVRTLRSLGDDVKCEDVAVPKVAVSSRHQIRVCTHFFKGNMACLRRYIEENDWIEEKDNLPDRCVYVWYVRLLVTVFLSATNPHLLG